jgi:hypothetical protein
MPEPRVPKSVSTLRQFRIFMCTKLSDFLRKDVQEFRADGLINRHILYVKDAYKAVINKFLLRSFEVQTGRRRSAGIFESLSFSDRYLIS